MPDATIEITEKGGDTRPDAADGRADPTTQPAAANAATSKDAPADTPGKGSAEPAQKSPAGASPNQGEPCPHCKAPYVRGPGLRCPACGKSPRGRPALSPEEKAARDAEKAARLAGGTAVAAGVAAQAPAKVDAAPKYKPTAEQITKTETALETTFEFLGDMVYEIACNPPTPTFSTMKTSDGRRTRARVLAEAWAEIVAENMGPHSGEILKYGIALTVTGAVVTKGIKDVREHNKVNPKAEEKK